MIRLWRHPVEAVLSSGIGTLPFAPLARVRRRDLPGVLQRMQDRLSAEVPRPTAAKLWAATYVLMGLRYPRALADRLLGDRGEVVFSRRSGDDLPDVPENWRVATDRRYGDTRIVRYEKKAM